MSLYSDPEIVELNAEKTTIKYIKSVLSERGVPLPTTQKTKAVCKLLVFFKKNSIFGLFKKFSFIFFVKKNILFRC